MELTISHGIIEGEGLRGSEATERGRVWEGGFPPPTVGSFFIFRLENMQSGAYLRRKFRLDDMFYIIITLYGIENKPWYNRWGGVWEGPPPTVGNF